MCLEKRLLAFVQSRAVRHVFKINLRTLFISMHEVLVCTVLLRWQTFTSSMQNTFKALGLFNRVVKRNSTGSDCYLKRTILATSICSVMLPHAFLILSALDFETLSRFPFSKFLRSPALDHSFNVFCPGDVESFAFLFCCIPQPDPNGPWFEQELE